MSGTTVTSASLKEKHLVCPIQSCGKKFKEKSNLAIHVRIHNGERPFKCTFVNCDKSFLTRGNLKSHLDFHFGIRRLKCPYEGCQNAYAQKNRLRTHLRTHEGVKPFKCEYPGCDKRFNEKGNLVSHLRSHSGQKTFKCYIDNCKATFALSTELRKHLITHDSTKNEFYCPYCTLSFSRYVTVLVHIKVHQTNLNKDKSKRFFSTIKSEEIQEMDPEKKIHHYGCNKLDRKDKTNNQDLETMSPVLDIAAIGNILLNTKRLKSESESRDSYFDFDSSFDGFNSFLKKSSGMVCALSCKMHLATIFQQ